MNSDIVYRGVFLPMDQSEAGTLAFYHGLKLALSTRVPLRLLHVQAADSASSPGTFPKVRVTLSRWQGRSISTKNLVEMGLAVRKNVVLSDDPIAAILAGLGRHRGQLAVLAPHTHRGFAESFLHQSVSNAVARKSRGLTLFVPEYGRGFVNPEDGTLELDQILFPIDHEPYSQPALDLLEQLSADLELEKVTGHLLQISNGEEVHCFPSAQPRWSWQRHFHEGEPVAGILEKAVSLNARLIVMTSEGRHGLMDSVRGSVTERVIKQAPCPVLVIHSS